MNRTMMNISQSFLLQSAKTIRDEIWQLKKICFLKFSQFKSKMYLLIIQTLIKYPWIV